MIYKDKTRASQERFKLFSGTTVLLLLLGGVIGFTMAVQAAERVLVR